MSKIAVPLVETTRDFVLIKIPRGLFKGTISSKKFSDLGQGLQESLEELRQGKAIGPFSNARDLFKSLRSRR